MKWIEDGRFEVLFIFLWCFYGDVGLKYVLVLNGLRGVIEEYIIL